MRYASLLLLCASCTEPPDVVVENTGAACLQLDGRETGSGLFVRVSGVVENDCVEDLQATCSVLRDGNTLIVDARASWNHPPGPGCNRQAAYFEAHCAAPRLSDGAYELEYGSRVPFSIPLQDPLCARNEVP